MGHAGSRRRLALLLIQRKNSGTHGAGARLHPALKSEPPFLLIQGNNRDGGGRRLPRATASAEEKQSRQAMRRTRVSAPMIDRRS